MKISVYSLKKVLFDGEATSINCETTSGEITILDHHRPLITVLKKGVITIVNQEHKEDFIPIESGFLEVTSNNRIRLIVEKE